MSRQIGVAIVSYNTAPLLRRCLQTVSADATGIVVVVDNASTDGSAELVRKEFPNVTLVAASENCGYGTAANVAIKMLDTPHVLLLNADTIVPVGAADALAAYLEAHPSVAVAGPRLVREDGVYERSAHRFPTPLYLLLQESGLRRLVGRLRTEDDSTRADWLLGAALAIRREAFESAGGFDERYFLYQEEVDLCWRLGKLGWEVHFAPVATIVHTGGASTSQSEAEMLAQFVKSTLRFSHDHLPGSSPRRVRAVLFAVLVARAMRDRIILTTARDPLRQRRLRDRLAVWGAALGEVRNDA